MLVIIHEGHNSKKFIVMTGKGTKIISNLFVKFIKQYFVIKKMNFFTVPGIKFLEMLSILPCRYTCSLVLAFPVYFLIGSQNRRDSDQKDM